jgi:hypothetical protein
MIKFSEKYATVAVRLPKIQHWLHDEWDFAARGWHPSHDMIECMKFMLKADSFSCLISDRIVSSIMAYWTYSERHVSVL